jgi:hypothetical protein
MFSSVVAYSAIGSVKNMFIRLSVCVCSVAFYSSRTAELIFMKSDITEFIKFVDMLQYWLKSDKQRIVLH